MASSNLLPFFIRNNLTAIDRTSCINFACDLFPNARVTPLEFQGYCSYGLLVTSDLAPGDHKSSTADAIVQFRPHCYALDVQIAKAAKIAYGSYAPTVIDLGHILLERCRSRERTSLLVYQMDRIPGLPYRHLQVRSRKLDVVAFEKQERLVRDFSNFLALGWKEGSAAQASDISRSCTGKVGSCIAAKLSKLSMELPSLSLRHRARRAMLDLHKLKYLPVVLSHGDVVPSNIMVDEATGRLRGLVDWAEAEYLPFGFCLYGLDHLLGYTSTPPRSDEEGTRTTWTYYDHADALRTAFWDELEKNIPTITLDDRVREAVELARDVGVLLWHGFAWDDGAIDRVINEKEDAVEMECLDVFLGCGGSVDTRART
ncbi:hypothetical protein B0A49_08756 [Cryomyces minteri]|uniref:Aminoglycoside phosphotransferase domain-containing protein n=1 Tax=Cryomyces minteri TaxID=331657 RepID=A0A4U0WUM3_9PEZI|nr:hypothetical protein B0A49_08756 [Cryomyces minteri]